MFGICYYVDGYKIKSRIFTCKYSRGFNWICIMYSIGYLYICKLYHIILSISTFTSFQSNWNIDTINILSSYNCYLTLMNFINIIKGISNLSYRSFFPPVLELLVQNVSPCTSDICILMFWLTYYLIHGCVLIIFINFIGVK
jgi:hypothetical protein